jgi:hypothetical protein
VKVADHLRRFGRIALNDILPGNYVFANFCGGAGEFILASFLRLYSADVHLSNRRVPGSLLPEREPSFVFDVEILKKPRRHRGTSSARK